MTFCSAAVSLLAAVLKHLIMLQLLLLLSWFCIEEVMAQLDECNTLGHLEDWCIRNHN